jgi:hypothetical protein
MQIANSQLLLFRSIHIDPISYRQQYASTFITIQLHINPQSSLPYHSMRSYAISIIRKLKNRQAEKAILGIESEAETNAPPQLPPLRSLPSQKL